MIFFCILIIDLYIYIYKNISILRLQTISKGLSIFGETVATTLTGSSSSTSPHHHQHPATFGPHSTSSGPLNSAGLSSGGGGAAHKSTGSSRHGSGGTTSQQDPSNSAHAGIVTIVDFTQVKHKTVSAGILYQ